MHMSTGILPKGGEVKSSKGLGHPNRIRLTRRFSGVSLKTIKEIKQPDAEREGGCESLEAKQPGPQPRQTFIPAKLQEKATYSFRGEIFQMSPD